MPVDWQDFEPADGSAPAKNGTDWKDFEPVQEGNTLTDTVKSVAKGANLAVGRIFQGIAADTAPRTIIRTPSPDNPLLAEFRPGPKDFSKIQANPLYKTGKYIAETGEQINSGEPTLTKKTAEMAGGFLPIALSGPMAPATIGLQGIGDTLNDKFDEYKKSGMPEDQAAEKALQVAELTGGVQALTWAVLPKPLKTVVEKVIGDTGTSALKQFLTRRARGAVEGLALGATTKAEENLTTDKPLGEGVGSAALGLGAVSALMPQSGRYRRPAPPAAPVERRVAGLLPEKTGPTYRVSPEGHAVNVSEMTDFEKNELGREANAISRQTESGQDRVVNTVDAALRAGDQPADLVVDYGGGKYHKVGDYWVTDNPPKSMDKPVLRSGRGNVTEDAIVRELDARLATAKQAKAKTATQNKVEDITGVSRERQKPAEGTDLSFREQWEKAIMKRWGSPLSEYGPNGALSGAQKQKLSAFSRYLGSEDVGVLDRLWHSINRTNPRVAPKYPYDIELNRMLSERLGYEIPEPEVESGKIGEGQKQIEPGSEEPPAPPATPPAPVTPPQPLNPGGALKDLPQNLQDKSNSVKDKMKSEFEALKKQKTAPQPDWRVTVQAAHGDAPAAIQIIDPRQTETDKSPTVESLKSAGHDVPDFSKLPQGRYTYEEAVKLANAAPEAVSPAAAPPDSFPKFLTDIWGESEPPPTGVGSALHEDRFTKGQPSRPEVIQALNHAIEMGKPLDKVVEAIKSSRNPRGALNKIALIQGDPAKVAEARRQATGQQPTPSEVAAQNAPPKAESQVELETWRNAWAEKQAALRSLRTGTDKNGQTLSGPAREALPGKIQEANKIIEAMKAKHGTPDPGKYQAKESGEPTLPKESSAPREQVKLGDTVTREVNGEKQTGKVVGTSGDMGTLMVQFGSNERPLIEPLSRDWKLDTGGPAAPVAAKEYGESDFRKEIMDTKPQGMSILKTEKTREALHAALEKTEPGLMKKGFDKIKELRDALAKRGVDPDSREAKSEPEGYRIETIKDTLNRAARFQNAVDKGYKSASATEAKSWTEAAKKWIAGTEEAADPTFREKAEKIASKLDVLKTPEKGTLSSFGVIPKVINEAVDAAKAVIRAGGSTLDAISAAVKYINEAVGKAWKEADFRKAAEDRLETPKPKQFLSTWIRDDLAPTLGRGYDAGKAAINLMINSFSPTTGAKPGDVDILMESKGLKEKMMVRAAAALEESRNSINKMSRADQVKFIDRIKRGIAQPTPELQQVADTMRKWDDRLYEMAKKYKPDLNYLDNHYRVLWKVIPGTEGRSGTALEQIMAKRPWRGNRGFTLKHTLEDMSEGIQKGGVPVSYNPVDMFMLHAQDVMKFISANRAFENLKESGSAQFVPRGQEPPPGFTRIDDTITKQYFSSKDMPAGEWWIEKEVGRAIKNFLSRDYIRENALGRGLLDLKNATTAIELGVSPFHAVFVTNEAIGSSLGLAVAKMFSGRPGEALETLRTAGQIPSEGKYLSEYAKRPEDFRSNYPEEYDWLKKKYPDFERMVNDIFSGGGLIEMHDDYKVQAAKGFQEARANNNYIGMVTRAIPALNQELLKPIFQRYIPRLKIGTFMREYAFELDRRSKDLESGKVTRGQLARQTWNFIDDRFGELNWDNLYWDRTFKTAMQLLFRSVTWKLGNIRGFGKAANDTVREFGVDWWKEGRAPRMTMPMAWAAGMALVTVVESSIISRIFTGKYPWELAKNAADLARNLTFPRTDESDESQRVSVPTYFKDLVHAQHDPVNYVHSSMSGEIGRMADIWNNKDFYGTQIYNPDDPFFTRAKDKMEHLIPVPFSVSSYQAAQKSGASKAQSELGYVGFTKAPYYMSHSPAEMMASELLQNQLPQGSRTRENAEKSINEHKAVQAIKRGDMTIREAIDQGLVSEKKYKELYVRSHESFLETQLKRSSMTPVDAIKIWDVASEDERSKIHNTIELKIIHSRSLSPNEKEKLLARLNKKS